MKSCPACQPNPWPVCLNMSFLVYIPFNRNFSLLKKWWPEKRNWLISIAIGPVLLREKYCNIQSQRLRAYGKFSRLSAAKFGYVFIYWAEPGFDWVQTARRRSPEASIYSLMSAAETVRRRNLASAWAVLPATQSEDARTLSSISASPKTALICEAEGIILTWHPCY